MDNQEKKTLTSTLSKLDSIADLDLLIEEKQRLVRLKEKEMNLRKELFFTRVESEFGFSSDGFNSGTFIKGISKAVFKTKPEIANSRLMKGINLALNYLPFVQRIIGK